MKRKRFEASGKKENHVLDYRITWRYCCAYSQKDIIKKNIEYFLSKNIAIMVFDSELNYYTMKNGKLSSKKNSLKYDYGTTSEYIDFEANCELNEEARHYLFEIADMIIHKNIMFNNMSAENLFYVVLEPMVVQYECITLLMYPLIKIRDGLLMVEFRIYPGKTQMTDLEFLDNYSTIMYQKIQNIKIGQNLYVYLHPESSSKDKEVFEYNGYKWVLQEVPAEEFSYQKDIALCLLSVFKESREISWLSRTTYSVNYEDNKSGKYVPLMFSYGAKVSSNEKISFKDYRENDDYSHFVNAEISMTVGAIMDSYMFADCLDEEILFMAMQSNKFQSQVYGMGELNEQNLLNLYSEILIFKETYLTKYNHLSQVNHIVKDVWKLLEIEELLEVIQNLLSLQLQKLEFKKNKYQNYLQWGISVIIIVLSSSTIYEYIVSPLYAILTQASVNTNSIKICLYLFSIFISLTFVMLIRKTITQEIKAKSNGLQIEKYKNKKTKWLEENEVWFRTVLKFSTALLTITISLFVAKVGYQEYKLKNNQAILSQMEIEKEEREKQPFFTINQKYDSGKNQYIYSILNTGGQVRYSNLHLEPFVFIAIHNNDNADSSDIQRAFIRILGVFQYEDITTDDVLLCFRDKWVDTTLLEETPIYHNDSATILVNSYLNHLAWKNGTTLEEQWISANIVYHLKASYYDYKNDEKFEEVWYARSNDMSDNTVGNNTLFIQNSMEQWYSEAVDAGNIYDIDSLNISLEETLRECDEIMADFTKEH